MTSELKPCPFCGANAKVKPSSLGCYAVFCENLHRGVATSSKETAAAEWNTRAVPDVPELVRYEFSEGVGEYVEREDGEYVLHTQAAEIIAAKQADYDAEYNSLVEQHNQAVKTIESWIDTCAELEKRSEDLKADAARYQYLRSRDVETIRKGGVFAGVTPENYVINGIDLDIAIDLAMKADKLDVKGESNV